VLTFPAAHLAGRNHEELLETIRSKRNVVVEMIATLIAIKSARKPGDKPAIRFTSA